MKRIHMIVLGALTVAVAACSANPTREEIGTGVGAAAGGAIGHVLTGGSTLGTVGGAAAGALIGREVGEKQDGQRAR